MTALPLIESATWDRCIAAPSGRRAKDLHSSSTLIDIEPSPIFDGIIRDTNDFEAEVAASNAALAIFRGDRETALAALLEAQTLILAAMAIDEKRAGGDPR